MAGKGEGLAYRNYFLPVSIMALTSTAGYVRIVRSTMLEVLDSEFVKLARSKGVSERVIIWKHAFRNALLAPLTVAGLMLVGFITGSVAVEAVFAWPGLAAYAGSGRASEQSPGCGCDHPGLHLSIHRRFIYG